MKIVSTNVFVGPNVFAHFPVIRHVLDLGELEEWPTARLGETFIDPLLDFLPGLHDHGCSYREAGGFVRRLREDEGTWLGHVMEHVAIELQNVAGSEVTFGRTRSIDGQPRHYNMVFQYKDEAVGREASVLALKLIYSLLPADLQPESAPAEDWDFAEERDVFIRYAQRRAFGPSTASLVQAAEERGIPWLGRMNRESSNWNTCAKRKKRLWITLTEFKLTVKGGFKIYIRYITTTYILLPLYQLTTKEYQLTIPPLFLTNVKKRCTSSK